jgi:hypothetical protein
MSLIIFLPEEENMAAETEFGKKMAAEKAQSVDEAKTRIEKILEEFILEDKKREKLLIELAGLIPKIDKEDAMKTSNALAALEITFQKSLAEILQLTLSKKYTEEILEQMGIKP